MTSQVFRSSLCDPAVYWPYCCLTHFVARVLLSKVARPGGHGPGFSAITFALVDSPSLLLALVCAYCSTPASSYIQSEAGHGRGCRRSCNCFVSQVPGSQQQCSDSLHCNPGASAVLGDGTVGTFARPRPGLGPRPCGFGGHGPILGPADEGLLHHAAHQRHVSDAGPCGVGHALFHVLGLRRLAQCSHLGCARRHGGLLGHQAAHPGQPQARPLPEFGRTPVSGRWVHPMLHGPHDQAAWAQAAHQGRRGYSYMGGHFWGPGSASTPAHCRLGTSM